MTIESIIEDVIRAEGGYVDHVNDRGGATNWGITEAVARANGWKGSMRDLPKDFARDIYRRRYVVDPGFDRIATLAQAVAEELVDTGVNMGPRVATRFLQRALNSLNRQQTDYRDLVMDGDYGPATHSALSAYLAKRGKEGEVFLVRLLNALQGERYVALTEQRQANESFMYGWLRRLA